MNEMLSRIPLVLMALFSILVAVASLRFLAMGLESAFSGPPFEAFLLNDRWLFIAHVTAAPMALALGSVQFFKGFRSASLKRHRWIGRLYALSILIGGVSAMLLTPSMQDRPTAAMGFLVLGILWLWTTWQAVYAARHKQIVKHQDWMIRSFALTASALTLRIYLAGFMLFGYDYYEVSTLLAWMAWVPNLIFAEWYIRRRTNTTSPAVH